jgi:hypothetical protein
MCSNAVRLSFILLALGWALAATPQDSKRPLPVVASAAVPLYPPLARAAHVQGIVHVKVTTDGRRVIAANVEDGHKLLASAAQDNARTWEFATHDPTSFTVVYHYKLDTKLKGDPNNPTVLLRLPTYVEVSSVPMPPLDTAGSSAAGKGR